DEAALVTLAHHAAAAVQKARLLAREQAARAEAEAASRGKDHLLAMLGHELRNPLAAIANAMRVLDAQNAPAESTTRAREIIARQNAQLAHLVDDLLDVARVTLGKIVLERRPVELAQAVRHAVATLAETGRTQRHTVGLDLDSVWADVDETRFEQIVINLVGNALKFTPPEGTVEVTLRARARGPRGARGCRRPAGTYRDPASASRRRAGRHRPSRLRRLSDCAASARVRGRQVDSSRRVDRVRSTGRPSPRARGRLRHPRRQARVARRALRRHRRRRVRHPLTGRTTG